MITDKFCFIARLVLIGFNIPIFSGSGETWPAEWYFEQLQQQWHPRYAKPPQTRTAHYPGKPVRDRTSLEFCGGKCLGKNCSHEYLRKLWRIWWCHQNVHNNHIGYQEKQFFVSFFDEFTTLIYIHN